MKFSITEIVAIISATGIIGWISTNFLGGMIIWLLSYGIIIIPIILLYVFSIFETSISLLKKGTQENKIKLIAHGTVLFSILTISLYHSEVFKSEPILTAVLKDDLCHYRLVFRKDRTVENQINGFMGFSQTIHGKYKIKNDLIIFNPKPHDNDFIPDTLLIDKQQHAIFIKKDKDGKFINEKEWLNHFEIIEN
ncbi:hypothetical protein [Persicobacter sp. CCB-QB2]|uniref:hypothetical protein n=1 Tax=Persicobacter sp. CCB-QB2 TaxID=1561025 RepID=UPI0006A9B3AA|nr:hypothetical protein [Persicobacter sp. CCB-QB2]